MPNEDVNRPKQEASAQPQRPPFPPGELEEELIEEEVAPKPGRLERLAARFRKPADTSREAKATERTRALVILGVTSIACLFLFFGLFTTDSSSSNRERRTKPNLGRPEQSAVAPENANRSPVPQLSVNQQPNEEPSELSEKDLLATMRNRGTPAPNDATPTTPPEPKTLASVRFDDPALAEAYRRQGLTPPSPRTEVEAWDAPRPVSAPPPAVAPVNPNEALRKSSIVFVRSSIGQTDTVTATAPALEQKVAAMFPQGTALVARLQHAVSSAAKVPVIAVIEYNYERDGALVVPAGTKAYGELSQATPQGWVSLQFHTLELPGGEREKINGSAVSMERTALRGDVNGRNSGKKFLTRALTGVGTIAAYAVGGRGLGSNGLDSSILLRERLASNVALGGEQELARLAYQQNIVVTVPANNRFYLVLNADAAGQRPAAGPPIQGTGQVLSAQELREMIQLRDELREMNRLATRNLQAGSTATPALPQEEK